jgi:type I restriction enzyme S subunit
MKEARVLSLSYGRVVVKPPEKLHGLVPASFETYQVIEPDDIICRPTDLQNDWNSLRFGLARDRGIITSAYLCLHTQDGLSRDFGFLLLHSYDLLKVFYGLGSGLRQNLDWPDFKYLPCVAPPLPDQSAIVRYLDYVDRRIQKYIRAKQKLIALLNEQKQAIIHEAVTGRIDVRTGKPYPKYKPSGVPWVSMMPDHWQLRPNRAMLRKRKALVGDRHAEYRMLSLTKQGVILRDMSSGKGKFSADIGTSQIVSRGDLVFCLFDVPETPRTVGLSPHDGMITGAYTIFECSEPSLAAFVEHFYVAMDDRKLLGTLYSGLRNTIPPTRFLGIKTPIPPPDERDAIAHHISAAMVDINGAYEVARKEMTLLREYRTRLEADVVTGKLDVREAAASLPEEEPEEAEGPESADGEEEAEMVEEAGEQEENDV